MRVALAAAFLLWSMDAEAGHFRGRFSAVFDGDGRHVTLTEPYAYIDDRDKEWSVPSGWTVDGASIPRALWSIIGGPLDGKYRNASVIHDYYCDTKTEPWWDVHEVFYEAMLSSGVDPAKARIMYLAVYHFGPRWPSQVKTVLYQWQYECDWTGKCDYSYLPKEYTDTVDYEQNAFSKEDLEKIESFVAEHPQDALADPPTALESALGRSTLKR